MRLIECIKRALGGACACIENMRNDRVLRRNTFKFPEFRSHASIFAIQVDRLFGMEVDLSANSSNFSAIFARIVIERAIYDEEEDSRYDLSWMLRRIDFV